MLRIDAEVHATGSWGSAQRIALSGFDHRRRQLA